MWTVMLYDLSAVNSHVLPSNISPPKTKVLHKETCTTFCQLYMSTLYCLMRFQIRAPTTQHPTCGDCAHWRFSPCFCRSALYLQVNQLQQLPPGVFSSLTSLRSLTCVVVCIENVCVHICAWLPSSAYYGQLKPELHLRGRVNNNACK